MTDRLRYCRFSGRLVVPFTSLSQPVSTLDLVPTCVQVMSESTQMPNIFPIPFMGTNPLRPSHEHDLPTNPNEELHHRQLRNAPLVTPPPFSVFE